MKKFSKTKSLTSVLKELPIGETIVITNFQARSTSVRTAVYKLNKLGYELKATSDGLINKISVTKISNN